MEPQTSQISNLLVTDHPGFSSLADGIRREILGLLAAGPLPAGEIAARFPVTRPAVSRHLRLLREAGLVAEERRGRVRLYRLLPGAVGELAGWLTGLVAASTAGSAGPRREGEASVEDASPPAAPAGGWRCW